MKWLPEFGRVQMSECGRYTVQHPTSDAWVAYAIPTYGTPEKLGERGSDVKARGLCIAHEAQATAARARA